MCATVCRMQSIISQPNQQTNQMTNGEFSLLQNHMTYCIVANEHKEHSFSVGSFAHASHERTQDE